MARPIKHIVIVGGGTAGWLTACILASEFRDSAGTPSINVSLIESPNIPTLGVGEGTWPSMRSTLQAIGLASQHLSLPAQPASSRAHCLRTGFITGIDTFTRSRLHCEKALQTWGQRGSAQKSESSFAWSTCPSASLAFGDRAPKQIDPRIRLRRKLRLSHLDAGAFAQLLTQHGVEQLGVKHHLPRY